MARPRARGTASRRPGPPSSASACRRPADVLAALPYYDFHPFGVEQRRAELDPAGGRAGRLVRGDRRPADRRRPRAADRPARDRAVDRRRGRRPGARRPGRGQRRRLPPAERRRLRARRRAARRRRPDARAARAVARRAGQGHPAARAERHRAAALRPPARTPRPHRARADAGTLVVRTTRGARTTSTASRSDRHGPRAPRARRRSRAPLAWPASTDLLRERIVVMDGAMGTLIQSYELARRTTAASDSPTTRATCAATATCSRWSGRTSSWRSTARTSMPAPTSSRPTRSPRPASPRPTTG